MKKISEKVKYWFLFLILSIFSGFAPGASADENEINNVKTPIRLNVDMISGLNIEPFPWNDETRLAKWSQLFTGEELSVSVFESTPLNAKEGPAPSKNRVRNYPYDQFVLVLSGKAVLTDSNGFSQAFTAGDFFVVPRGFDGTWEDYGVYRELIVVMEEALRTRKLDLEQIK